MWVLVGVTKAHYPEEIDTEERVALFTSEQKAQKYEKDARLSTFSMWCHRGHGRQYRKNSLLRRFCRAYVEHFEAEELPVDPEL